jgi:hypothetical protein
LTIWRLRGAVLNYRAMLDSAPSMRSTECAIITKIELRSAPLVDANMATPRAESWRDGENWLIPVDGELGSDRDAESEVIPLKLATLHAANGSSLGLVMLERAATTRLRRRCR